MSKTMRSAPPTALAVLFAAVMASRRLMRPSVPWLAIRAAMLLVSPSKVSEAVVTARVLTVSLSAFWTETSDGFSLL